MSAKVIQIRVVTVHVFKLSYCLSMHMCFIICACVSIYTSKCNGYISIVYYHIKVSTCMYIQQITLC